MKTTLNTQQYVDHLSHPPPPHHHQLYPSQLLHHPNHQVIDALLDQSPNDDDRMRVAADAADHQQQLVYATIPTNAQQQHPINGIYQDKRLSPAADQGMFCQII